MPQITIAAVNISNWQGNGSGIALRIYANKPFTAQSGNIVPQSKTCNPSSLGTFFQSIACTVSGGQLQVPAVILDSTVDSPDNPDATYTAVLWDGASNQAIQQFGSQAQFAVPAAPTATTWAALFSAAAD